jgi:hypothetical protein
MWNDSPEINSRGGLAWLLTFYAASTKSVITLYWKVQWTCGFLHCKVDFKHVPSSTRGAPETSRLKSYGRFIMQVLTGMKWRSKANFLDPCSERVILGFEACPNNCLNAIVQDPCSEQVILGFQACPNNRLNRILWDPWFEVVILGPTVSCCLLLHVYLYCLFHVYS